MTDQIECAFTGRLGTDPVERATKAGKPWLSFSVVVGADDAAQWMQVALFGDGVEDAKARLRKGERCYVEGTIRFDTWQDKTGGQRHDLKVSSFKAIPIGQIGQRRPKANKLSAGQTDDANRRDYARPQTSSAFDSAPGPDDQIPF